MDWRHVFFRCTILRHFLARPRGVLSETYRYEEISLFPKDLNENYHPSDFAEKVVDPKSFRNILTSTLGWTVSFVLAFFLVVQLTYTRETIRLLDERQISLAQATADSIATRYRNLGIIAEGALDDFPRSQLCCLAASTAENSAFCTCCIPASRKGPGTIRVIAFSRSSRTKYP